MRPKTPKHKRMKPSGKEPGHLDLIRRVPCILTGRPAEAAHIRYPAPEHGKGITGMGRKPEDKWVVPLCPELHRMLKGCQHDSAEREWWAQFGVDPCAVALRMHGKTVLQMERISIMVQPSRPEVKAKIVAILKGAK
jgi:hypothetical protein